MDELKLHLSNGRILAYVSLVAIVITLVTYLIFKKYRYMKYFPGFIFMIIGIYNLYKVSGELTSSESIRNILIFVIGFAGGIIGLFTGLIIGIYNKERKEKRRKDKKE